MAEENTIKGTTSIRILLDSNYCETMVRIETEEKNKWPYHAGT